MTFVASGRKIQLVARSFFSKSNNGSSALRFSKSETIEYGGFLRMKAHDRVLAVPG